MLREIQITSRCESLSFNPEAVEQCLRLLDQDPCFSIPEGDLSIVFLTDDEIGELHGTFLGDPSPTDVITFPGDPDFGEAGEICVSAHRAKAVHRDHSVSLSEEILLYLAHGWLHLAGYDDKSKEDSLAMRDGERQAMALLKPILPTLSFLLPD